MAHERPRHALNHILKKAKLWPVIGLLGARQIGKSTILREQIQKKLKANYLLLDRKSIQTKAQKAPEYFIQSQSNNQKIPLILDEVQKAPDLFNAIKAEVDEERIPGRFILSGSTEFSDKTGIRESLTGRIGISHLYPFTIAETLGLDFASPWVNKKPAARCTPADIDRYLERGGMPGACFLRSEDERKAYYGSWLDTTCHRDLQQIKTGRLEGELALDILYVLASSLTPSIATIKLKLRTDSRKILRHIGALQALFVIRPIQPHSLGIGKTEYHIFDSGLAKYLEAPIEISRRIWIMNEIFAQYEYSGLPVPKLTYYRTSKHSNIDFILDDRKTERAIMILDEEAPSEYALRGLKAFHKKSPESNLCVVAPLHRVETDEHGIVYLPWTNMV